ncbi:MAG TPA: type II toxin-antitoxin system RelE/ParE family toxin [Candidatus Binatia bacterium]|nr:type II toxin-antitoxin system RelE/ParE family toxin [Candidatus Binatia bacterium]
MATGYDFTPHCRAVLQQIRTAYSRQQLAPLFQALRAIAANPLLPGSGLFHHDPTHSNDRLYRVPSALFSPAFIIFYRVTDDGIVLFINVWHPP